MYSVSIGKIEEAIYDLEKHFNKDYNGMTNRECVEELRKLCPKLHSDNYLKKFCMNLLDDMISEFGFLSVRMWYRINMKYAFFGHEMLQMKYSKLYEDICKFIDDYREKYYLTLKLDVYLASVFFKELFKKEYGVIDPDYIGDLYSILKTIHKSGYNPIIIKELTDLIMGELWICGDNYYIKKDLSDVDVIKELFIVIAEEMGDDEVYKGHQMFYRYDGYGESYIC